MGNSSEYQGYFLVEQFDDTDRPIIDGIKPLNAWPCGSCAMGEVYFVAWFKDGLVEDQDPNFATIVDFSLNVVDARMQSPIAYAIFTGGPLPENTLPTVRYLIESDRAEGLTGDNILDRRAGILGSNFLGFTLDSVLLENPWINPATVWRCNLGPDVES